MRKRIVLITMFLLLGAIVNVAVAWTCAVWPTLGYEEYITSFDRDDERWVQRIGADPPFIGRSKSTIWSVRRSGLGVEYRWGGNWERIDPRETPSGEHSISAACGLPTLGMFGKKSVPVLSLASAVPPVRIASQSTIDLPVRWQGKRANHFFDRFLPLTPIWPGFAINTIFYAAILGVLFFATRTPGVVRRAFRRRRGLCPACAYPIGTSEVCTECGKPVMSRTLRSHHV